VSLRDDEFVSTGDTDQIVTGEKTFEQIHIGMDPASYSLSLFHVSSGAGNESVPLIPSNTVTWGPESGAGFVEAIVVASVTSQNVPTCYRVAFSIDAGGGVLSFPPTKLAGEATLVITYFSGPPGSSSGYVYPMALCLGASGRSVRYATSLTYTRVSYEA
jgi:hypothetical protein